jgi:poly(A) polymerase
VRFACRLGFTIEAHTLAAIRAQAAHVTVVSAERVRDECEKMWAGPDPARALGLCHETGLLGAVLPEVAALHGVPQPPDRHPEGDVLTHTRLALAALPADRSAILAWGTLLHDIGKPATLSRGTDGRIHFLRHDEVGATMVEALADRLRFSRHLREGVVALVRHHLRFFDAPRMRAATLKRFLREPGFAEMLALHRADVLASLGDLSTHEYCARALAANPPEVLRPPPLLRGEDVIGLGVPRGPKVGEALAALEEAQLEGVVSTRSAAEALVRARFFPG